VLIDRLELDALLESWKARPPDPARSTQARLAVLEGHARRRAAKDLTC
jgi:hypothetical protein